MMETKPPIADFYHGQKNLPDLLIESVTLGGLGVMYPYGVPITIEDTNIVVITQLTIIPPFLQVGGVLGVVPTLADCGLTQNFLRIDGNEVMGIEVGGFGIGIPCAPVTSTYRLRVILRAGAQLQWWYWCSAPSLVNVGDAIFVDMIISAHYFDRKVMQYYSNFDILSFVKDLGD